MLAVWLCVHVLLVSFCLLSNTFNLNQNIRNCNLQPEIDFVHCFSDPNSSEDYTEIEQTDGEAVLNGHILSES